MGKIKKVARSDEPIVRVEIVLEPVVVQVPMLAIPVQIPRVAVAVRVLPNKLRKCRPRHCLLKNLEAVPMI